MCCKRFRKRVIPFVLTFTLGLFVVNFAKQWDANKKQEELSISQSIKAPNKIPFTRESGIGFSGGSSNNSKELDCFACKDGKFKPTEKIQPAKKLSSETRAIKILSKPLAGYTNLARENVEQGTVKLKVTFLSNGRIGEIKVIKGLNYGLTERAIESALNIKFQPATVEGKPITVTKQVEYNFMIY